MIKKEKEDIFELMGDYGKYVCNVGKAMDKVGISISKMRKLTGLNHEIVKKYYNDQIVRVDKDVFARLSYVLSKYGIDPASLFEYISPKKDDVHKPFN